MEISHKTKHFHPGEYEKFQSSASDPIARGFRFDGFDTDEKVPEKAIERQKELPSDSESADNNSISLFDPTPKSAGKEPSSKINPNTKKVKKDQQRANEITIRVLRSQLQNLRDCRDDYNVALDNIQNLKTDLRDFESKNKFLERKNSRMKEEFDNLEELHSQLQAKYDKQKAINRSQKTEILRLSMKLESANLKLQELEMLLQNKSGTEGQTIETRTFTKKNNPGVFTGDENSD